MTDTKWLKILGWVATCTAMLMYISYFPQIVSNLHGDKSGKKTALYLAIETKRKKGIIIKRYPILQVLKFLDEREKRIC